MSVTTGPRVERLMGTAFGFDVRDDVDSERMEVAVDRAVDWLRRAEDAFTVFREDSHVRRYARGEVAFDDAGPHLREVLSACEQLRAETGGDFDHRPVGPTGVVFDPSGYVKGWAVDQAAMLLRMGGLRRFSINAGGDVWCGDGPLAGTGWRVGIRHPQDPTAVCAVLEVENTAVATSGRYERGAHVWGSDVPALDSVTVVGPEMGRADALATAVLASDSVLPAWFPGDGSVDALCVIGGHLRWTDGLRGRLIAPGRT